jgi:hypothetical protein
MFLNNFNRQFLSISFINNSLFISASKEKGINIQFTRNNKRIRQFETIFKPDIHHIISFDRNVVLKISFNIPEKNLLCLTTSEGSWNYSKSEKLSICFRFRQDCVEMRKHEHDVHVSAMRTFY